MTLLQVPARGAGAWKALCEVSATGPIASESPAEIAATRKTRETTDRSVGIVKSVRVARGGIIADAVDANYLTPREHRQLSVIQELFRGHERPTADSIDTRLAPWWGEGERAWLFDNVSDNLRFNNRSTGFDLTFILDDAIGAV